jgi:protease-4
MDTPIFSAPSGDSPPPFISPPPRPRKSRGWMITSFILAGLLILCVLVIGAQFVFRAITLGHGFKSMTMREAGPRLDEAILEDNNSHNKIAVITVDGIISSHADTAGNDMVEVIKAQLDRAADDDSVRAVILKVDSPGGEVMASDQINKAIADFESDEPAEAGQPARHGKPVICSMGSLAASGGYYISAPCRWIVADDLTLTGSIGVIMHGWNYRGLMDKIGVAPMTYKSGKFKDMLSPDRETNDIPPEEHQMVQALIDETFGKFKEVVRDGRSHAHDLNKKEGKPLAANWQNFADGRVLSGTQALQLGFVDQLGDFDNAVDRAEEIAHIHNANLVEYSEHYDLSDFLSRFSEAGQAKDIKLDLGLQMPKLHAGLYFLAPDLIN